MLLHEYLMIFYCPLDGEHTKLPGSAFVFVCGNVFRGLLMVEEALYAL